MVGRNGDGSLEVFAVDKKGKRWHREQIDRNGEWSIDWASFGSGVASW